jgi:hypothetical protein
MVLLVFWLLQCCEDYDSQMVFKCTVYRKSMALYSYFGSRVYIHLELLWAAKIYIIYLGSTLAFKLGFTFPFTHSKEKTDMLNIL